MNPLLLFLLVLCANRYLVEVQCWPKQLGGRRYYSNKRSFLSCCDKANELSTWASLPVAESFMEANLYERKSSLNNSGLGKEELMYADEDILVSDT